MQWRSLHFFILSVLQQACTCTNALWETVWTSRIKAIISTVYIVAAAYVECLFQNSIFPQTEWSEIIIGNGTVGCLRKIDNLSVMHLRSMAYHNSSLQMVQIGIYNHNRKKRASSNVATHDDKANWKCFEKTTIMVLCILTLTVLASMVLDWCFLATWACLPVGRKLGPCEKPNTWISTKYIDESMLMTAEWISKHRWINAQYMDECSSHRRVNAKYLNKYLYIHGWIHLSGKSSGLQDLTVSVSWSFDETSKNSI